MAEDNTKTNTGTGADPLKVAPPASGKAAGATEDQEAQRAAEAAQKAREEAEMSKLTPEERRAREAERDAAAAASKAVATKTHVAPRDADTVATAAVHAPVDPGMPASHHMAQKFGNDPANPKLADGIDEHYEGPTVRLSMKKPDVADLVYVDVPEVMVGDYLRAGWNR